MTGNYHHHYHYHSKIKKQVLSKGWLHYNRGGAGSDAQGGGEGSEDTFQDQSLLPSPAALVLLSLPEPLLRGGKRCCHRSLRTLSAISLEEAEKRSSSHSLEDKPQKVHWLRRPQAPVGSGGRPRRPEEGAAWGGRGGGCSPFSWLRRGTCAVPEAAPGSCPARAAGGGAARSAQVGSGWAMEPLPEPTSRPRLRPRPRCLLLLPLLLLLLLLLPAPELGPREARAEETDWVRLPSKCEGEGAGPAGSIQLGGRGLRRRSWALERVSSART